MRSSISSSNRPLFYSRLLIALCTLVIGALEAGYTYSLTRSGTYHRVSRQYSDVAQIRASHPGEPPSIVMVGNSLLLDGVQVDRLRELTATRVRVYPLFLEGTAYLDWFYGLTRLFRKGARPDVVMVGLSLDSLLDDGVRQQYAPRLLFDARDILAVSAETKMDRTVTASLLLAHWSTFWNMRHVIRVQLLTHGLPYFEHLYLSDLWSHLRSKRIVPIGSADEGEAVARLQRLRGLCAAYGARVVLLVPPTPTSPASVERLTSVTAASRVDALMPINPAALEAKYFRADDIHVNEDGAALFTDALALALTH
jgi:hypothetical protein